MATPLLSSNPPGRISQVLPTVKCSNCTQPVPLNELGDHVCLSAPTLPKPSGVVSALLPQRQQGRFASPNPPSLRSAPNDMTFYSTPPGPQQQRITTPLADRLNTALKISAASSNSPGHQQRPSLFAYAEPGRAAPSSSTGYSKPPSPNSRSLARAELDGRDKFYPKLPLAYAGPSNKDPSSVVVPDRLASLSHVAFPLRAPPPLTGNSRPRTSSNSASLPYNNAVPPTMKRPSFSAPQSHPRSDMRDPFPQPRDPSPFLPERRPSADHVPRVSTREIDTKIGGSAGMAGVGRRGFAAAAHAAMIAASVNQPVAPQSQPGHRDNIPRDLNINLPPRLVETPPLSAGSGHSSSPGLSPFPQSPIVSHDVTRQQSAHNMKVPPLPIRMVNPIIAATISPTSSLMPLPEHSPIKLPNVAATDRFERLPTDIASNIDTPSTARQPPLPRRAFESGSSASPYNMTPFVRSNSSSTSRREPEVKRPLTPASESDSDLGGLAYADSAHSAEYASNYQGKADPPSSTTLGISGSDPITETSNVRFLPGSDRNGRGVIRIPISSSGNKRDASVSSMSSSSSRSQDNNSKQSNSAAIAHALGLSQSPPSDYIRLGGPGKMGGRIGSSRGGSGSQSTYSRSSRRWVESSGLGLGTLEKEVATLLEAAREVPKAGLSRSESQNDNETRSLGSKTGMTHRSNTVQGITASESRSLKLPIRSRTSTERNVDGKKEWIKKEKVCLKCRTKIENGRWIRVDGESGGVLCESCWKNMYLPKCRRCNLPIEKQAISSADGQLKGKYHRECFNCDTCHTPFPDKSFYVLDGKPLCAYHYHEANNSLCAAARCGQPIEGPCAVSHMGDRYHPQHMTCEHPGDPACMLRLEEYWEVDGRMLCERHAHASTVKGDDEGEAEQEWVQSSRALKRITRFIDLTGK